MFIVFLSCILIVVFFLYFTSLNMILCCEFNTYLSYFCCNYVKFRCLFSITLYIVYVNYNCISIKYYKLFFTVLFVTFQIFIYIKNGRHLRQNRGQNRAEYKLVFISFCYPKICLKRFIRYLVCSVSYSRSKVNRKNVQASRFLQLQ